MVETKKPPGIGVPAAASEFRHAWRPDGSDNIPTPHFLQAVDLAADPPFRTIGAQIHLLGPRPLIELLAEIVAAHPGELERIRRYAGLDPALLRAMGADRIPALPGPRRVA